MKDLHPVSAYKGYKFSNIPLTPLSGDVIMMVYTKGHIEPGKVEFDISTKKYKSVTVVERADKNYFVVLTPKIATVADGAIEYLEGHTRIDASSNK